jgi:histidinol-phosphatase
MENFLAELEFANHLALLAGDIAMAGFGGKVQSAQKHDGTWVTDVDRAVEEELRRRIAEELPEHNFLGEEGGLAGPSGGAAIPGAPTWIVDPIDGTNNYMTAIPVWATLVALRIDETSVLGVCHAPALGETYAAARGSGARLNGQSIEVNRIARIEDAAMLSAGIEAAVQRGLQDFYVSLAARCWRTRGFGDFWGHMLVARGAAGLMFEPQLSTWDFSALEPIVEEAGGRITRLDGRPCTDGGSCLSSNGALHEEILSLFRRSVPGWQETAV